MSIVHEIGYDNGENCEIAAGRWCGGGKLLSGAGCAYALICGRHESWHLESLADLNHEESPSAQSMSIALNGLMLEERVTLMVRVSAEDQKVW